MRLIDADAFLERIQNDASLCAEIKLYGLKVLKNILICNLPHMTLTRLWKNCMKKEQKYY